MANRKVISASIAVDIQNVKELTGTVESLNKGFSDIKMDKNLEPRLKSMENTVKSVSQEMEKLKEEIGILSKAGGFDPKVLSQYAEMSSAMAEMRVEVDALVGQIGNLSKAMNGVKDVGIKNLTQSITQELSGVTEVANSVITNTITSIQKEAPKLKEAYAEVLKSLGSIVSDNDFAAELGEVDIDLNKIFNFTDEDSVFNQIEKINKKLKEDLSNLKETTNNYMTLKNNGVSGFEIASALKKQIDAITILRKDYEAVVNSEDFYDYNFDDKVAKKMPELVDEIRKTIEGTTNLFPELKNTSFKTFEDIYDFIFDIIEQIQKEVSSNLEIIDNAIKETDNTAKKANVLQSKTKHDSEDNDVSARMKLRNEDSSIVLEELRTIIKNLQEYANTHPVQMDVSIAPSWGSKNTQKYLTAIREQLKKVQKDKDISPELIDKINSLQGAFGEDFTKALKNTIGKLQTELKNEGIVVGKLKLDPQSIVDFKTQLEESLGEVAVNVKANIQDVDPTNSEASQKVKEMFDAIEESGELSVNSIQELLNTMKETGGTLDFSDAYKNRLKQIIQGMLEGIYGSIPEAIAKTKKARTNDTPIDEFYNNKFQIDKLRKQLINEKDVDKSKEIIAKANELIKRNNEIIESERKKLVDEEQQGEEDIIGNATQKIDQAQIDIGTATININNADTKILAGTVEKSVTDEVKSKSENNAEQIIAPIKDAAKTVETVLKATEKDLKQYANQRYKELSSKSNIDFKGIDEYVKDLKRAGINSISNPKVLNTTVGRIIDKMLKDNYESSREAFKSLTDHSAQAQANAMAAKMQSDLFNSFKKIYEKQTIQESGTGSKKSIQMFVDKVRKSGIDFKVAEKYQDNEIGKLINSMLTEGYKTVADAIQTRDGIANSQEVKTIQQNVNKANIDVGTATINVKSSTVNINGSKSITNTENTKAHKTIDEEKHIQSIIDKYNKNIQNMDSMSVDKFLHLQKELLAQLPSNTLEDSVGNKLNDSIEYNSDAIHKAVNEMDKLLSKASNNSSIGRAFLFGSGKIFRGKEHELSYNLSGDKYQRGSVNTLLNAGQTLTNDPNAYTTEMVHNHPSNDLRPSFKDIYTWFYSLSKKKKDVSNKNKLGEFDDSFNTFITSIVGITNNANEEVRKLSFDMSNLLKGSKSDNIDVRNDLLYGAIASKMFNKTSNKDILIPLLNMLSGGAFSITSIDKEGNKRNEELEALSEKDKNALKSLISFLKDNFNLNTFNILGNKNKHNDYINAFYKDNESTIRQILSGVPSVQNANNLISSLKKSVYGNLENSLSDEKLILNDSAFEDGEISYGNKIEQYMKQINEIISYTIDEALKEKLIRFSKSIENNYKILTQPLDASNIDKEIKEIAIFNLENDIPNAARIIDAFNKKAREIHEFIADIDEINKVIEASGRLNIATAARENIVKAGEELDNLREQLIIADKTGDYSEIDSKEIISKIRFLKEEVTHSVNQTLADQSQILGVIRKIDNMHLGEVRVDKGIETKLLKYRDELSRAVGTNAEEMLDSRFQTILKSVGTLSKGVSASDRTVWGNFMKEWRHKNYQMLAQFFSFYDIIRYMREAITVVKEYDSALIEMMKVSDETRASLERYQSTLFDTADAIGSSALTLNQSTADWMRIGESLTEAAESAKAAQILMNVSEFESINDATQALVSASQAYADLDKMDIVDKINKLGNEFPIATDQLATALQNSAAALTTQGNSLDEALALVVGGNIITQDAMKTGTGIRTIALRIAGTKEAKDELVELGEDVDDFIVRTESKTRKLIMDYTAVASNGFKGVDVYDDNGNLRSTYAILQDIADIYKEIQQEDKKAGTNRANALVELLAGKNRSNIAASILTNPDTLREAFEAAGNAEGSALKENEKYLTSVEAHIVKFKNAVDELINDLVDSGFINDVIDFGTKLVNIVDQLVDGIGGLGTLFLGGGLIYGFKEGWFTDIGKNISTLTNALTSTDLAEIFTKAGSAELRFTEITKALGDAALTTEGRLFLENAQLLQDQELSDAATISTLKLKAAKKSLWGAIGTIVVLAVVAAISKYVQKLKEAQKATQDLAKENQKQNESLEDYAKRISKAKETIDNEFSSTDEIIEAKKELITIQEELNDSYGNYNEIIKDTNKSLEENNRQLIANREVKVKETLGEARGTEVFGVGGNQLDTEVLNFFEDFKFTEGSKGSKTANYLAGQFSEYFDEMTDDYHGTKYYRFKGATPEEALNNLREMKLLLSGNEYANSEEAQEALQYINDKITEIQTKIENNSSIYEAYGESQAIDKFNKDYKSLMNAWLKNAELGTDATAKELEAEVTKMWHAASDANEKGVQYWLKSMFGAYFDEINAEELNKKWDNRIDQIAADINDDRNGKHYELSYEDVLAALNGESLDGKLTRDQIEDIKNIKKILKRAGIDDYGAALDKIGIFRHEEDIDFETQYAEARQKAIEKGLMTGEQFDELGIKTSDVLDIWNQKIANTADNATEAMRMLALATSGLDDAISASDMLKNMESQYKPAFDAMAEAYKAIWSESGFDITEVTSEQLESVRSQIESLNGSLKELGAEGIDSDEIDKFILTLADSSTTAEEAQEAFNEMATSLVDSLAPALGQASGETAALIIKTLTELGVTDAEKVAFDRLGFTIEQYNKAKEEAAKKDIDIDAGLSGLTDLQYEFIATNDVLREYYSDRILANTVNIETADDVNALIRLCKQLGISIDMVKGLAAAEKALNYADSLEAKANDMSSYIPDNVRQDMRDKANEIRENALNDFKQEAEVEWKTEVEYDGNKSKSSSTKDSSKDSKQKFDWIERAIKKIQRAVTNLGKVADATYKKWEERLGGVTGKYEKLQEEVILQQQAADAYMQEAYAVGLNPVYMDKVMNGLMDIETVTDETLKEQISDFQELYLNMQPYLMMVWKIILTAGNPQRQLHYNIRMKYA